MPLPIRLVNAKVKNPETGQMDDAGLIGSDAISTIEAAKNTAVEAVEAKGAETIASIPNDYTELSNGVGDLKNAVFNITTTDASSYSREARWTKLSGEVTTSSSYSSAEIPIHDGDKKIIIKAPTDTWINIGVFSTAITGAGDYSSYRLFTLQIDAGETYEYNVIDRESGGVTYPYNELHYYISAKLNSSGWASTDAKVSYVNDNIEKINSILEQYALVSFTPTITKGEGLTTNASNPGKQITSDVNACTGIELGYGYKVAVNLSDLTYAYRVFYFPENGSTATGNAIGYTEYLQGMQYIPSTAPEFALSFKRVDSATMTDADVTAISSALTAYSATDSGLAMRGKAADAKATGDAIADLKNAYEGTFIALDFSPTLYKGERIDIDTGRKVTTGTVPKKYVRTDLITGYPHCFAVNLNSALYEYRIMYYAEGGSLTDANAQDKYLGLSPFNQMGIKYIPSNAVSFALSIRRVDQAEMANADVTAIAQALIFYASVAEEVNDIKETINLNRKDRTGEFEFFTVNVDRPLSFGDEDVIDDTAAEEIECVLRLPVSYRAYGKPTQLVLACHGASGYIDSANNTWYNSNWKEFMDQLLNAGYAVFDANVLPVSAGVSPTNIAGYAVGSPLYVNILKKAYDYITENYNVTKQIFAHGTSMGGVGATAFSHAFPEIVLAESSFAGREFLRYLVTIKNNEADERFAPAYGYENISALNADKFSHSEGTFPSLSIIKYVDGVAQIPPDRETAYSDWLTYYSQIADLTRDADSGVWIGKRSVPYKAWNSWADSVAYVKLQTVLQKAYNRGNACPYYLVNYESGTHTELSYGQINNMIPQLIAWYKRWE